MEVSRNQPRRRTVPPGCTENFPGPRLSHGRAAYPALSREGFVQNIQVKWCFHGRLCQNRGVIRRVNSSGTGTASCPGLPAVEHASWKGFLSGGRATPTKGCSAKGRGTPRRWVFLVYNPTSKWQSFASHVVQGGRAFPMQPKLASNLQQFSGLGPSSAKITGMSHQAQIKQTPDQTNYILENYSLKVFFYLFTYLLENIKLNLWIVL